MTGFPAKDLEYLLEDLRERGIRLEGLAGKLTQSVSEKLVMTVVAQIKKQLSKLVM